MESVDEIAQKLGACVAQPKLDGLRIQVHKFIEDGAVAVRFFSRNLLDVTHMFPDLVKTVAEFPAQSLIAEGEAIAFDFARGGFLAFQETSKRRRKHEVAEATSSNPLQLYLFDLLFLNGEALLGQSHSLRRDRLTKLFAERTHSQAILKLIEEKEFFEPDALLRAEKLEEYFETQLEQGLEGLVVKRADASYKAGKRNFNWVKLKRLEKTSLEDTIDCVIMGYYFGRGKRASFGLGALLVGVYNAETDSFETVCKIGTGMSDVDLASYKKLCDQNKLAHKPANFVVAKILEPDVWTAPVVVVCVRADQISKSPSHTAAQTILGQGLALRFPRLVALRVDKSALDATSAAELATMSTLQRLG
jgi:DNA ligase-1